MRDEIIYPFLNCNNVTVEVWEWIGNFISQFAGHVVTYPCWKLSHVSTIKEPHSVIVWTIIQGPFYVVALGHVDWGLSHWEMLHIRYVSTNVNIRYTWTALSHWLRDSTDREQAPPVRTHSVLWIYTGLRRGQFGKWEKAPDICIVIHVSCRFSKLNTREEQCLRLLKTIKHHHTCLTQILVVMNWLRSFWKK